MATMSLRTKKAAGPSHTLGVAPLLGRFAATDAFAGTDSRTARLSTEPRGGILPDRFLPGARPPSARSAFPAFTYARRPISAITSALARVTAAPPDLHQLCPSPYTRGYT